MKANRGFTLVELAVVMVILSVIMFGAMSLIGSAEREKAVSNARVEIRLAMEALNGFAAVNGRFPCPATNADDLTEQPAGGGVCDAQSGFLPTKTLGISSIDPWSRPLRYAVATTFKIDPVPGSAPFYFPQNAITITDEVRKITGGNITNLNACGDSTRNHTIVLGEGAPCPAGSTLVGNNLFVGVWSNGSDAASTDDDLAEWTNGNVARAKMASIRLF